MNDHRTPPTSRRRRTLAVAAVGALALTASMAIGAGPANAIVGGVIARPGEVPWQAMVGGATRCGAAVIDASYVLTAAHCVDGGVAPEELWVRTGTLQLSGDDGQERSVVRIVLHPVTRGNGGDLALLELDEPLELDADTQAVPIATPAELAAADIARVSGWGVQGEHDVHSSRQLRWVDTPLLTDRECAYDLGGGFDGAVHECAEADGGGSCYGDSGGPLVIDADTPRPKLAGIVSWGTYCGDGIDVYTEVPAFSRWIRAQQA